MTNQLRVHTVDSYENVKRSGSEDFGNRKPVHRVDSARSAPGTSLTWRTVHTVDSRDAGLTHSAFKVATEFSAACLWVSLGQFSSTFFGLVAQIDAVNRNLSAA